VSILQQVDLPSFVTGEDHVDNVHVNPSHANVRGSPTGQDSSHNDPNNMTHPVHRHLSTSHDFSQLTPELTTGLDLSQFDSFGQTINVSELKSQISELKMHLKHSQQALLSFQSSTRIAGGHLHDCSKDNFTPLKESGAPTSRTVTFGQNVSDKHLRDQRRESNTESHSGRITPDGGGAKIPNPYPPMTPFSDTKQANQEAFNRLQQEVEGLQRRLRQSEDLNATLRSQLDESYHGNQGPTKEQLEEVLEVI
jgi:hypothetical protein